MHSSFRIMKHDVARAVIDANHPQPIVGFLICGVTDKIGNLDIPHYHRQDGGSTHNVTKLFSYFFNIVFSYSDFTLRLISYIGLASFLVSLLLSIIYFFLWYYEITTLPGFTTQLLAICLFSGLILLSLGIIGVYIDRLVRTLARTDQYLVREIIKPENFHSDVPE